MTVFLVKGSRTISPRSNTSKACDLSLSGQKAGTGLAGSVCTRSLLCVSYVLSLTSRIDMQFVGEQCPRDEVGGAEQQRKRRIKDTRLMVTI